MSTTTSTPKFAPIPEPRTTPDRPENPQRTAGGQYARGNRGGPGNPFNRQIAAFRTMIVSTTTLDDVREAALKLIEAARQGNLAAIKLFFQYVVGKPTDAVDPDRMDVDEFKLCEQSNIGGEACQAVHIDGMPVRLATELAGIMEEAKYKNFQKQAAENEAAIAEQARIDAAEDAAIQRGIEESIRQYKEQKAAGTLPPAPPPLTLEEILGLVPQRSANGGNRVPTANQVSIGGETPPANRDIGGIAGPPTPATGKRRPKPQVAA